MSENTIYVDDGRIVNVNELLRIEFAFDSFMFSRSRYSFSQLPCLGRQSGHVNLKQEQIDLTRQQRVQDLDSATAFLHDFTFLMCRNQASDAISPEQPVPWSHLHRRV